MNVECGCGQPIYYTPCGDICLRCFKTYGWRRGTPEESSIVFHLPEGWDYGVMLTDQYGNFKYLTNVMLGVEIKHLPYNIAKAQFTDCTESQVPCKLVKLSRYTPFGVREILGNYTPR